MWYVAGAWENVRGKEMPVYGINIESDDGIMAVRGMYPNRYLNPDEHGFGRFMFSRHHGIIGQCFTQSDVGVLVPIAWVMRNLKMV